MKKSTLIEKEGVLQCQKHKLDIIIVNTNSDIQASDQLLCLACYSELKTVNSKVFSVDQIKKQISARFDDASMKEDQDRENLVAGLISFCKVVNDFQTQINQIFEDVQNQTVDWVKQLRQIGNQAFLSNLQQLLSQSSKIDSSKFSKDVTVANSTFSVKIFQMLQGLIEGKTIEKENEMLNMILKGNLQQIPDTTLRPDSEKQMKLDIQNQIVQMPKEFGPISQELKDEAEHTQQAVLAFNFDSKKLIASSNSIIKIWTIEEEQLISPIKLTGHTQNLFTIVASKKINWFVSGGEDQTLRGWISTDSLEWKSCHPQKHHTGSIQQIVLNQNEDYLFSCSLDKTIKVWKVNCKNNDIRLEQSLEQHTGGVRGMSINESETFLASTSQDRTICIWTKNENQKWQFRFPIQKSTQAFGSRISFINDNQIAWCQASVGTVLIFELENKKFSEKPNLKIFLDDQEEYYPSNFSSIFNAEQQVLIQVYSQKMYIIRRHRDGIFKVEGKPISCSCGTLSHDASLLAVHLSGSGKLRLYKMIYE